MNAIDGDSHFSEPLDLFERYTEPAPRAHRARRADSTTGERSLIVDGKPMVLVDVEELLGALVGYGQKESGADLGTFDRYLIESGRWQDMSERVRYLDSEGFAAQVIYRASVSSGKARSRTRCSPTRSAARTTRGPSSSAPGMPIVSTPRRTSRFATRRSRSASSSAWRSSAARTIFVAAAPVDGKSFGHASLDPVWAAAQDLDLAVGIHLVGHPNYTGHDWYRDEYPGFMFVTMNVIQDPRMALTTMVYDGVFERFPRLRAGTIEAMVGWVGEWLERLDYRFKYMGHTSKMKRPASEYFRRNIWISADPEERMFPLILKFAGDERFFIGSDYPHAEGFVKPVEKVTKLLADFPIAIGGADPRRQRVRVLRNSNAPRRPVACNNISAVDHFPSRGHHAKEVEERGERRDYGEAERRPWPVRLPEAACDQRCDQVDEAGDETVDAERRRPPLGRRDIGEIGARLSLVDGEEDTVEREHGQDSLLRSGDEQSRGRDAVEHVGESNDRSAADPVAERPDRDGCENEGSVQQRIQ